MPFFSIVIPTYNRAELLAKTLDSALAQTFVDFEVLIIDDGSTDATMEVVSSINDPRIKYVYQENGERGKARNTGVKIAEGNYIFFLDSDDLLYPNHLAHAFSNLQTLNFPVFFHSRYALVDEHKTRILQDLNKKNLLQKVQSQNLFACQFFLRREEALLFPFSENRQLKIGEDWEVILKIAHRYPLHFSNETTAAILAHGGRTMQLAQAEDFLLSRDLLTDNLRRDTVIPNEVIDNVWAELTTLAALAASISENKKPAISLWWAGIKRRPSHTFKRRTFAIFKKIITGWIN